MPLNIFMRQMQVGSPHLQAAWTRVWGDDGNAFLCCLALNSRLGCHIFICACEAAEEVQYLTASIRNNQSLLSCMVADMH